MTGGKQADESKIQNSKTGLTRRASMKNVIAFFENVTGLDIDGDGSHFLNTFTKI